MQRPAEQPGAPRDRVSLSDEAANDDERGGSAGASGLAQQMQANFTPSVHAGEIVREGDAIGQMSGGGQATQHGSHYISEHLGGERISVSDSGVIRAPHAMKIHGINPGGGANGGVAVFEKPTLRELMSVDRNAAQRNQSLGGGSETALTDSL
jgi:hypothetical protein